MINIDIKKQIQGLTKVGFPFMEGKENGKLEENKIYTVNEFDYMNDEKGDYIVFTVKEDDKHFYFGGQVLTDTFKKIELQYSNILDELLEEGIPFKATKKLSKNKRQYTAIELYPNL